MIYSNYLKMTNEELEKEISKQKKKIDDAKETIRLLRKLQLAAEAEAEKKKQQTSQPEQPQKPKLESERRPPNGFVR